LLADCRRARCIGVGDTYLDLEETIAFAPLLACFLDLAIARERPEQGHAIAVSTAEQLADRLAAGLAERVIQRDVDRRLGSVVSRHCVQGVLGVGGTRDR